MSAFPELTSDPVFGVRQEFEGSGGLAGNAAFAEQPQQLE